MWPIISNYIGIFILGIGEVIFARITLNDTTKTNSKQTILILIISTILFYLVSLYFTGTIKTILLYIAHVFEFKLLFDINYFQSIFLTFLYAIVLIVPDILSLIIITKIFGMNKMNFYKGIAGTFTGNFIICILFIITTLILKRVLRKIIKIEISSKNKILILSCLALVSVSIYFYIFIREYKINGNVTPYIMTIVFFLIITFNLIKQTIKNSKKAIEYDILMERMAKYEIHIENERILRHESKNELRTIRAMICEKQRKKEIIDYIDEIVNDKYEIEKEKYSKFAYLPPNGIKGLCYFKTQEAENIGIKVSINISKQIKDSILYDLNVKQQRDLGRILGVVLDNAIEASLESKEKQLGIEAYATEDYKIKFIISNTYNNKLDISKIGKERFSTKGKNRGHGLLLVKQLINRNSILEIEMANLNNIYVSTIIIKNN